MLSIILLLSCNNITSNQSYTIDGYIVNESVETFIQQEEGFRAKPYICKGGILTIGYGTKAISLNDIVDKEEAAKRLRDYLNEVTYKKIVRYNIKPTPNQLIAISSFDFNTNKMINLINKDKTINCDKILLYNKVKVKTSDGYKYEVSSGLNKRRIKEYNICIQK